MEEKRAIADLASRLIQPFTHLVLGQVDDYCAYLTQMEGSYLVHQHAKDELYLVLEGEIVIEYASGAQVTLQQGESLVVRAGERHRSRADRPALVLIFKARDLFAE